MLRSYPPCRSTLPPPKPAGPGFGAFQGSLTEASGRCHLEPCRGAWQPSNLSEYSNRCSLNLFWVLLRTWWWWWGGVLLPLLGLRSLPFCLRLVPSVPSVNDLWKFSAVTFSGCGGWKRLMFPWISARIRHASRWFPGKRLRSHQWVHLRGVASLQRNWKVSLKAFVG